MLRQENNLQTNTRQENRSKQEYYLIIKSSIGVISITNTIRLYMNDLSFPIMVKFDS